MSHRQKNSHKSRHRRHAMQPAPLPLLTLGKALRAASTVPSNPQPAQVWVADEEEDLVTQADASRL